MDRLSVSTYMLALVASELVVAFVDVPAGIAAYAVVLVFLVNRYAAAAESEAEPREPGSAPAALLALSLIPLLHIVALSVPVAGATRVEQQAIVAGSLLPALALATWALRPPLRWPSRAGWLVDAGVAATGAALGLAAYLVARGEGLASSGRASVIVAGVLVVSLAGLVEELTFRGLVQTSLDALYPRSSSLWSSVLFVASYAAARPVSYLCVVAVMGLWFGLVVRGTRSLFGVVVGHALFNVGVLIVWPRLLP